MIVLVLVFGHTERILNLSQLSVGHQSLEDEVGSIYWRRIHSTVY